MKSAVQRDGDPPAFISEKFEIFFGLGLLVTVPFFAVQYHELFPVSIVPVTAIDRLIPFYAPAVFAYLSLYVLLALPLLLVRDPRAMRTMAFGFAWITVVSHLCFLLLPTSIPALSVAAGPTNALLDMVRSVDTSRNALPSLHASLAVFCALCAARLVKQRTSRIALWLWTPTILAATLLAKRHVFLDLVAGASLGLLAYAVLFRRREEEASESEALKETVRARSNLACGLETEIAQLARQDWRKRLAEVVCFGSLGIAGAALTCTAIAGSRWFFLPFGIVATALALNALVLLMHDGMHESLLQGREWNRVASVLIGSTFLMSFSAYRVLHTRHHRFLGDPRDPDDYKNYTRRRSLVWLLHFVRLSVGSLLYLLLIPILALKFGTDEERRHILTEYAFLGAIYSLLLRFVPISVLGVAWFVPLLIVGTLTAIRGFTQHGITDAADPYIASRTILPNRVVAFLLLNENYHLEHHLFPEIPSYHLPALHRLIWPKLPRAVSGRSYLGFLLHFFRATPQMDESPIGLEHPSAKL
jgi:fatty acid desaturase/membrane-associated phospholipid phosphatase